MLVGDGRFSKHFVDRVTGQGRPDGAVLRLSIPVLRHRRAHQALVLPAAAGSRARHACSSSSISMPCRFRCSAARCRAACKRVLMRAARRVLIRPLLAQDGRMVEAEQDAYERDPYAAGHELNPAVGAFQKLIVERWRRPSRTHSRTWPVNRSDRFRREPSWSPAPAAISVPTWSAVARLRPAGARPAAFGK